MIRFNYRAMNGQGYITKGVLIAENRSDLEQRLKSIGLEIIDFNISRSFLNFSAKVSKKDLIIFCIQLEQLEKVGVPILDALSDIRESSENIAMQNLVTDIIEAIKHGALFSEALMQHMDVFDDIFIGLVAVGEKSGQLAHIFHHLTEHLKWNENNSKRIKTASYYPLFMGFLLTIVVSVMMIFDIPKLSSFLAAQNIEMPFYTKALIATSSTLASDWYIILASVASITVIFKLIIKFFDTASFAYDNFKLSLWIIGPLVRKIEMGRFCRFFGVTFKSGIDLIECLNIADEVVKNKVIKKAIAEATLKILEGNSLTDSLRLTNQFPSLVIRMIKIGEDAGNLDEVIGEINKFYDKEIYDVIEILIKSMQPAFTIIMGVIMLWISMSIFGPIYGSFDKLNF